MNLAAIVNPHPAESTALVSRGRPTSYAELRNQVAGLRGALTSLGISPGDRVAIVYANNRGFVVSYLAVLGVGAIAVPLNPVSPSAELSSEIRTVGASMVIIGPGAWTNVQAIDRATIPSVRHVVAAEGHPFDDALVFDGLLEHEPSPIIERADSDVAVLMFTSGTAGAPKAAMLTHGNLLANLEQMQHSPGFTLERTDVLYGVIPLFHIFGLNVVLDLALYAGASVVLAERFDPVTALETIVQRHVTVIAGAPPMWVAWASTPGVDPTTFANVRLASSGAAKLPDGIAQTMFDRFGVTLTEGYGLTEAAPVVSSAAGLARRATSVGIPLVGVDLRLVDDDGDDVLTGDAGEIWVKGPNVFAGYWNDPAASAQALTADGWLRTGDIGVLDADGWLHIVDRVKDLIIVSGFNVFPAEVEDTIAEHPAVQEVVVVGTPHPYTGETVRAYVVVKPGSSTEEDDIIAFCGEQLARYKCPTKVLFVETLPRGATGKVLRRQLN